MTGKNAEDILVDRVNELTSEAAAFHSNMYASKNSLGRLPEQPKIPVETSYGISVHDDERHCEAHAGRDDAR